MSEQLTCENFESNIFRFRDRQAGVSLIFDPDYDAYQYNAYCLETKLMKELHSVEFDFLEDALDYINREFGNWEFANVAAKKQGCGSCAAK